MQIVLIQLNRFRFSFSFRRLRQHGHLIGRHGYGWRRPRRRVKRCVRFTQPSPLIWFFPLRFATTWRRRRRRRRHDRVASCTRGREKFGSTCLTDAAALISLESLYSCSFTERTDLHPLPFTIIFLPISYVFFSHYPGRRQWPRRG